MKKLVKDLLQKDPLRRPDANYLVETVPDFVDFITDTNWIEESNELESSNEDLLNRLRWVYRGNVYCFIFLFLQFSVKKYFIIEQIGSVSIFISDKFDASSTTV